MDEIININSTTNFKLKTNATPSQLADLLNHYVSEKAAQVASFFKAISCCVFRHLLEMTSNKAFSISTLESQMREMSLKFFHYLNSLEIWENIIESYKQKSFNISALFEEQKSHPYLEYLRSQTVITLAFDEASPLVTDDEVVSMQPSLPFQIIRRAAKMYEKHNIAFLMSRTTSKLANFGPPFIHDNIVYVRRTHHLSYFHHLY